MWRAPAPVHHMMIEPGLLNNLTPLSRMYTCHMITRRRETNGGIIGSLHKERRAETRVGVHAQLSTPLLDETEEDHAVGQERAHAPQA